MNARLAVLALVALVAPCASIQAVQPGDSRDVVMAELGVPTGSVARGEVEVLYFPRAEVRLNGGVVSAVVVTSAEELAAQQIAEAARAERRARLEQEGRTIRDEKINDAAFARLSAGAQLAYWQAFSARYPMVSVASEIAALRDRVEQEEHQREMARANERRLAELEGRVAEAEARAARAEAEAARAQRNVRSYGFGYFPIVRRHHDRPPHAPEEPAPKVTAPITPRGQAMGDIEENRAEIYRRSMQ